MNKPLSMIIKETQASMVNVCNESGLPLAILDLIIQGVYSNIHSLAERQSFEEEKAYTEALKESAKKGNTEKEVDVDAEK